MTPAERAPRVIEKWNRSDSEPLADLIQREIEEAVYDERVEGGFRMETAVMANVRAERERVLRLLDRVPLGIDYLEREKLGLCRKTRSSCTPATTECACDPSTF